MAKKRKINKSQAVRDYLKAHPKATSGEIATALNKKGIKITPAYVANIKATSKNGKAKKQAVVEVAAPAVVEKPTRAADAVTIEQIRAVTKTVQVIGGIPRLNELLGLVKEVGGLRKMKELLDAMTVSEDDVIPF